MAVELETASGADDESGGPQAISVQGRLPFTADNLDNLDSIVVGCDADSSAAAVGGATTSLSFADVGTLASSLTEAEAPGGQGRTTRVGSARHEADAHAAAAATAPGSSEALPLPLPLAGDKAEAEAAAATEAEASRERELHAKQAKRVFGKRATPQFPLKQLMQRSSTTLSSLVCAASEAATSDGAASSTAAPKESLPSPSPRRASVTAA